MWYDPLRGGLASEERTPSRLAQDLSHPLITMLQQECTRSTCPEMKAGEWLYLCVAHGNEGAMEVRATVPLALWRETRRLTPHHVAMLCNRLHPPHS